VHTLISHTYHPPLPTLTTHTHLSTHPLTHPPTHLHPHPTNPPTQPTHPPTFRSHIDWLREACDEQFEYLCSVEVNLLGGPWRNSAPNASFPVAEGGREGGREGGGGRGLRKRGKGGRMR